jgi:hypothetical protein
MINSYATLAEYKAYATPRGQDSLKVDTVDDGVIERLLEAASRYMDEETGGRQFYPSIATRYYSVPVDTTNDRRVWLAEDALEIISVTNGNGTTVTAAQYYAEARNYQPKWAVHLLESGSITWEGSGAGELANVIEVNAWEGYHEKYEQRGWINGGTLAAAIVDTTTLAFTMNDDYLVLKDQVIKIDDEIMIVNIDNDGTITPLARGDNGSTAASHVDDSVVYIWAPMATVVDAVLGMTHRGYANRSGAALGGAVTVTAAGMVIMPQDVPSRAQKTIERLTRRT